MTVVLHKSAFFRIFGGRCALLTASLLLAAQSSSAWAVSTATRGTPGTAVSPAPLPVDQAFPVFASFQKGEATVHFNTLPGHYLYRDRFEFALDGKRVELDSIKANIAQKGKIKTDPSFGDVAVFAEPVSFVAGKTAVNAKSAQLTVVYQGCSELAGVCYPPSKRNFTLASGAREVAPKELEKQGLADRFKKQVSQ